MVFFLILIIIVCILLTLVVLIQNPKGGGIAANFTSPNQIMGANRSTDVVEKATWILAIALIVLSLASNIVRPHADQEATGTDLKVNPEEMTATPSTTGGSATPAPNQQPADSNK